ncbi:alpha/beta hydrolase family protein [Deinococcus puniceus]|uniref:Alpha/beta hydrolase n=1 Tax=Deinococcus puniceus TaxID=1182568 RepID=A0A172TAE3_9DEIO|nr:alpha/beta hydrolase [Deinococcus puniceus]ANE43932.1 alpha/beta hydrolase [Deinococcus puniceus]
MRPLLTLSLSLLAAALLPHARAATPQNVLALPTPAPLQTPAVTPSSGPVPAETITLDRLSGPSFLRIPNTCRVQKCALVVVAHPRGQSAERLHNSPQVNVLIQALLDASFAVLLSDDGGENTWGSPAALDQVAGLHTDAVKEFEWSGRTYALGLSMGGLLALRSALPGSPYAVSGVALIDGWADLRAAWGGSMSRRTEIADAYGLGTAPPDPSLNPMAQLMNHAPLPLFVAASPDDGVVSMKANADVLYSRAEAGVSDWVILNGPHLGGNRFTPTLARQLAGFFERLETRELARGGVRR